MRKGGGGVVRVLAGRPLPRGGSAQDRRLPPGLSSGLELSSSLSLDRGEKRGER